MRPFEPIKLLTSLALLSLFFALTAPLLTAQEEATLYTHATYLPLVLGATALTDESSVAEEGEELATLAELTPAFQGQAAGFLRTQGQQIVDGNGQRVMWRGVNMDGYYYFDPSTWPDAQLNWYATERDIQYLDRLGVTAIRLVLHWKYFNSDLGYRFIDQYLAWCKAAGIYLILDMHIVPPDDDFGQEQIWYDPAAQQRLINLWRTLAARYSGETAIAAYDLYNEPRPPDGAQWWTLANRITDAIRTVDPNHIVIVETPSWPEITFALIDDANVVYSYHDYEPFIVSHAGMVWGVDTPVPSDYPYPGKVLTGFEWVGYAPDARSYTGRSTDWVYWDSGRLTPVANGQPGKKIEWAALKPYASDQAGTVWLDDLEVYKRGARLTVTNGGIEEAAPNDSSRPRAWYFYAPEESDYTGAWSDQAAHTGTYSLQLAGSRSFGVWTQYNEYFTAPLFPVRRGDTFQLKGWLYAPENNGGSVGFGLDYLTGVYTTYNYDRLRAYIQPTLDWAAANQVPLYVGEFGSRRDAPGRSRDNLIRDKIKLMNAENVHWSLWSFRSPENEPPGFSLYSGERVDKALAKILQQGMRR